MTPKAAALPSSVNHSLPSAAGAIAAGSLPVGTPAENSRMAPPAVTRPTAGAWPSSVNHTAPSGPAAIATGELPSRSPWVCSVICPPGLTWPIAPAESANHISPRAAAAMPSG
jgi:hypothetical protein